MSHTFDTPPEQQASCECREPVALATVPALPTRARAAVAWEPWLGEDTTVLHYTGATVQNRWSWCWRPLRGIAAAAARGRAVDRRRGAGPAAGHMGSGEAVAPDTGPL
jgi:hypothetical protein